ncbi:MAG: DUF3343 domain-containing protein [Acidimicrobiia bacterium]
MPSSLDGLLSFFASHHAIRAEKVMRDAAMEVQLIPGPKELSPNCGVALRFRYDEREAVLALLTEEQVTIDEVHLYRPSTDDWRTPRRGLRTRSFKLGRRT